MNDYQKMQKFLEGLDRESYEVFCKQVGRRHIVLTDNGTRTRDAGGTEIACPFEEHILYEIENILRYKSLDHASWRKYCNHAGIATDDATMVEHANTSKRAAWIAAMFAWIAVMFTFVNFVGLEWKDLLSWIR